MVGMCARVLRVRSVRVAVAGPQQRKLGHQIMVEFDFWRVVRASES